eukprot:7750076-Alexandrium_andersonii.AAC.1
MYHPCSSEAPSQNPYRNLQSPEQPLSSSDSESARKTVQNAPLGSFGDQFRGHAWARAVQALNA